MLKKILVASFLLVASMGSQATIIEYADYKRDTSGTCAVTETDCKYNIVTGGGLEWLKWDVTKGLSINQALGAYAGWTLASNAQMAELFKMFQFGKTNWFDDEVSWQGNSVAWNEAEYYAHQHFMNLFGYTFVNESNPYSKYDPRQIVSAFFGADADKDGRFNEAYISDDYIFDRVKFSAHAQISNDLYGRTYRRDTSGVALVRKVSVVPPTQVTLPGSLSLLALGLVALGFRRRKA